MHDLVFVANGNSRIGWGHLVRTCALVQEASSRGLTSVLVTFEGGDLLPVHQSGAEFVVLPLPGGVEYEEALISFLNQWKSRAIVLDLLSEERQLHQFLRASSPELRICSICSFRPNRDEQYFEDFLIYPGLDDDPVTVGPTVYQGIDYLIFRNSFVEAREKCHTRLAKEVPVVLVAMGGGDRVGLTLLAVKGLIQCKRNIQVRVVLTDKTSERSEVERLAKEHCFTVLRGTPSMENEILNCDVGVINGGMLRYEFALLERFFVAISLHEVQFGITERLTSYGIGINLGILGEVTPVELALQMEMALTESAGKAFARSELRVDTIGAQRIIKLIEDWI